MDITKTLSDVLKNPKQLMIAVGVTTLVVLFLYLNFLIVPQLMKIAEIRGRIGKMSADLTNAKADIEKIDSMKKVIEEYKKKVGQYEKLLPTKEDVPAILENLSEMARNANMRIAGIVPMDPKESKSRRIYQEIPIAISAKAGFHELGRFMASVENSDRFMKVVDIQIRYNRANPKKQDIELMTATYVLLEGK